jgi:phage gpG-like protein
VGDKVAWKMTIDYSNNETIAATANPYTGAHPLSGIEWKTVVINTVSRNTSTATDFLIIQKEISIDWYRN